MMLLYLYSLYFLLFDLKTSRVYTQHPYNNYMEIEAKKAKSRPICKYAFLQKKQLGLGLRP